MEIGQGSEKSKDKLEPTYTAMSGHGTNHDNLQRILVAISMQILSSKSRPVLPLVNFNLELHRQEFSRKCNFHLMKWTNHHSLLINEVGNCSPDYEPKLPCSHEMSRSC